LLLNIAANVSLSKNSDEPPEKCVNETLSKIGIRILNIKTTSFLDSLNVGGLLLPQQRIGVKLIFSVLVQICHIDSI
jgi:hypothetical protein